MFEAMEIARYFLAKDTNRTLFDKELIQRNDRRFYQGNARLNKYLHMAQNMYIAKTGRRLFGESLFAYDNGAVVPDVQENYSVIWNTSRAPELPSDVCDFLDRLYRVLENATLDDLIALSHEDSEWMVKHDGYAKQEQEMDSLAHVEEYKAQYRDMLKVMDRMTV